MMAWSNIQKAHFVRSCKAVGMAEEHRYLILGQLEQRAVHKGKLTSTSPKLTNADFDHAMAIVECQGNGQIKVRDKAGKFIFKAGHFSRTDEVIARRLRFIARHLVSQIFAGTDADHETQLTGWIDGHVRGGRCRTVDQLTVDQLQDLIHGLKAYAKRHHIQVPDPTPARMSASPSPSMQGRNDAFTALKPADIPF